jgi:hypothetical protein
MVDRRTQLRQTSYYPRSSVLGNGTVIAQQKDSQAQSVHKDPVTSSLRETCHERDPHRAPGRLEFDPLGNDAPLIDQARLTTLHRTTFTPART